MKRKIQIIEAKYDVKRDLVQWLVKDIEKDKMVILCWPGKDLGPAVGINAKLTAEQISKFCKDIEGKIINEISEVDMQEFNPTKFGSLKDFELDEDTQQLTPNSIRTIGKVQENLYEAHETLDKYPFYEVLQILEENKVFKDSLKKKNKEQTHYPGILKFLDPKNEKYRNPN